MIYRNETTGVTIPEKEFEKMVQDFIKENCSSYQVFEKFLDRTYTPSYLYTFIKDYEREADEIIQCEFKAYCDKEARKALGIFWKAER